MSGVCVGALKSHFEEAELNGPHPSHTSGSHVVGSFRPLCARHSPSLPRSRPPALPSPALPTGPICMTKWALVPRRPGRNREEHPAECQGTVVSRQLEFIWDRGRQGRGQRLGPRGDRLPGPAETNRCTHAHNKKHSVDVHVRAHARPSHTSRGRRRSGSVISLTEGIHHSCSLKSHPLN